VLRYAAKQFSSVVIPRFQQRGSHDDPIGLMLIIIIIIIIIEDLYNAI